MTEYAINFARSSNINIFLLDEKTKNIETVVIFESLPQIETGEEFVIMKYSSVLK